MSKYERLSRLLKIVTLVQANSKLNRKKLAERCEVGSVRTIQRDIDSLNYAGVPIYWSGDGYEIMPDFFLNPVALTAKETSCLIQAAEIFRASVGKTYEREIESALSKIIASLPEKTKENATVLCEEAGIFMEKSISRKQELVSAL